MPQRIRWQKNYQHAKKSCISGIISWHFEAGNGQASINFSQPSTNTCTASVRGSFLLAFCREKQIMGSCVPSVALLQLAESLQLFWEYSPSFATCKWTEAITPPPASIHNYGFSGWLASCKLISQGPSTSGPVHLSLLQPCGPKQAPHPAPEASSTHAKHLGSLPGIPRLAEGAVYDCSLLGFPVSEECCYFCSLVRSHKASFRKNWLEPQHKKKKKEFATIFLVPYHWRDWDLC